MDALAGRDPVQLMSEHAAALRAYARRAIVQGERLRDEEQHDKEARFTEFSALGHILKLTERELVCMMFRGVFTKDPEESASN